MLSTGDRPPFFGPRTPVYPLVPQVLRVTGAALSGVNVYPCVAEQFTPPLTLRDRETSLLWEPNGTPLNPGYYVARLVGSYLGLPLYVTYCCPPAISSSSHSLPSVSPASVSPSVSPSASHSPSSLSISSSSSNVSAGFCAGPFLVCLQGLSGPLAQYNGGYYSLAPVTASDGSRIFEFIFPDGASIVLFGQGSGATGDWTWFLYSQPYPNGGVLGNGTIQSLTFGCCVPLPCSASWELGDGPPTLTFYPTCGPAGPACAGSSSSVSGGGSSQAATSSSSGVGCLFTITATLNWPDNSDLDLYVANMTSGGIPNGVCYYGDLTVAGLSLNHDAHPVCAANPPAPEVTTGEFSGSTSFKVWYNQYINCSAQVSTGAVTATFVVDNIGSQTIQVSVPGQVFLIPPGQSVEVLNGFAYAGYNTGSQVDYQGGTPVDVYCVPPGPSIGSQSSIAGSGSPFGKSSESLTPVTLVTTACCINPIPSILYATISGVANPGTVQLIWIPASSPPTWVAQVKLCNGLTSLITLICQTPANVWVITIQNQQPGACIAAGGPATTAVCNPFFLTFNITGTGGCCLGNNILITVSQ